MPCMSATWIEFASSRIGKSKEYRERRERLALSWMRPCCQRW